MYCDPTRKVSVELGMVGFVDNCNGQTNSFHEDVTIHTVHRIVKQTQSNAQAWTDMLHASGGALELSKCSCHIILWQFSVQGAPVLVPKVSNSEYYQVQNWDKHSKRALLLQILGSYQAHKTLGHHKDPAGTQPNNFVSYCTRVTRLRPSCENIP